MEEEDPQNLQKKNYPCHKDYEPELGSEENSAKRKSRQKMKKPPPPPPSVSLNQRVSTVVPFKPYMNQDSSRSGDDKVKGKKTRKKSSEAVPFKPYLEQNHVEHQEAYPDLKENVKSVSKQSPLQQQKRDQSRKTSQKSSKKEAPSSGNPNDENE